MKIMAQVVLKLFKPYKTNTVIAKKYPRSMYNSGKFLITVVFLLTTMVFGATASSLKDDNDPENLKIAIYPNPSNGDFFNINILHHDAEFVEIKIYTALGEVVMTETFTLSTENQTFRLTPIQRLKEGIYMISIKTSNAQVTKRVIVRN
jgi:type IX secretion system substrate protein